MENKWEILTRMGIKSNLRGSYRLLLESGLPGRPMLWRKIMLGAVLGRRDGDGQTWIMSEWCAPCGRAFGLDEGNEYIKIHSIGDLSNSVGLVPSWQQRKTGGRTRLWIGNRSSLLPSLNLRCLVGMPSESWNSGQNWMLGILNVCIQTRSAWRQYVWKLMCGETGSKNGLERMSTFRVTRRKTQPRREEESKGRRGPGEYSILMFREGNSRERQ